MKLNDSLKNCKVLAVFGAALTLQTLSALATVECYVLNWHGTHYITNSAGRISSIYYSSQDVVRTLVNNYDPHADPSQFTLVYRPDKMDTGVVRLSDGFFISDFQQFQYNYTDESNKFGTGTVRQAFINDEEHSSVIGSIIAFENTTRDANGNRTYYSFYGSFQFSIDSNSKWPPGVYYGFFSVGRKILSPGT